MGFLTHFLLKRIARHDEERRLMPDRVGMNRDFTARRGAAFEVLWLLHLDLVMLLNAKDES